MEHCINVGESTNLLTYASMLYLTLKRTRALFCTETMAWNARQMDMVEDETLYQNVILTLPNLFKENFESLTSFISYAPISCLKSTQVESKEYGSNGFYRFWVSQDICFLFFSSKVKYV